ncbi:MAG: aryl-sulfate sulfotransferase [Chloroflexi bacterium]|nr:aryl-sulfate sulfotransferase [Chloroflexota bacterium]
MFPRLVLAATLPILMIVLAACGDDEPPVDVQATLVAVVQATVEAQVTPTAEPAPQPRVTRTSADIRADNALIAEVSVSLDRPARVYVEYENAEAGTFRTRTTESEATEHTVPVVRLKPSTTYSYKAFAIDIDGEVSKGVGGSFTTGALPEALARMELTVTGRPTGLVLFDLEDNPDSYYVALDEDSVVVWYYLHVPTLPEMPVSARTVRQKPNFNLVFLEGGPLGRRFNCCLNEITPLGEFVRRLAANPIDKSVNRDFLILSDTEVVYLAHEAITIDDTKNGGGPETEVLVDSIRIWDQTNNTTREVWNALDHFSLDQRVRWNADRQPIAWQRANSLAMGVRGNYIVSLANWNQVISISPDGGSIEWQLGGPDTDYFFESSADRFYGQHTASELRNGSILVYDNGNGRPEEEGGQYTRAIELALNTYDLGAIKVWEYRHTPDLYASGRGGAFRMKNGNTIINTESYTSDPPRVIAEVDGDGNEVWKAEVRSPTMRNSFRAYSYESILGEQRLP